MLPVQNTFELLNKVEVENLFQQLILQLNKDFQLSNLNETFDLAITPYQLKETLNKILLKLLTNNYDDYLNLMYRVDVPEKELVALKTENLETTIDQITFFCFKKRISKSLV